MTQSVARWRSETPGCEERIHLNNAGAALQPRPVLAAVHAHLEREAQIGGYEAAEEAAEKLQQCYADLALLLRTRSPNIAIVENATVALAQALSAFDFEPGDRIVTSTIDYPSNQIMYLSLARRLGVEVVRADNLPDGSVDPDSVRSLARHPRCRLVALSWVPTNSGLVQDAVAIGNVCDELGIPFLLDGCQAVGQLPVNVAELGCDFLAGTARKFLRGPRGIGFLYVADRVFDRGHYPLYVDMRGAKWLQPNGFSLADDARRFENWEFSYALVLGLGAAARHASDVGEEGLIRTRALTQELRRNLSALSSVRLLDQGHEQCAIVTAAVRGWNADDLKLALRERGLNVSASLREDGVIDMDAKGTPNVLRLSPHYYNTEGEISSAVALIEELATEVTR